MLRSISRPPHKPSSASAPSRRLPAVCILHGYGEGPLHSRRLRSMLVAAGYRITRDPLKADIVLSHSGGHLIIPGTMEGKLVLLVAPCNGYKGKSLLRAMARKIAMDLRSHAKEQAMASWLRKTSWNLVYILVNHSRHFRMLKNIKRSKELPDLGARHLGIVLYRNDPWSWYFDRNALMAKHQANFISHPGQHDDIWTHPEEYVAILQYLYETRILADANHR